MDFLGVKADKKLLGTMKVIITCRSTELSDEQRQTIFAIERNLTAIDHGYISPVQPDQFREYIKKFVEIVGKYQNTKLFGKFNTFKTSAEYEAIIDGN